VLVFWVLQITCTVPHGLAIEPSLEDVVLKGNWELAVSSKEDLEKWLAFTSSLVTRYQEFKIAHYLKGDALARLNRMEDALPEFTRSVDLDSGFVLGAMAKGLILSLKGESNDAQFPLLSVVQAEPTSAGIWAELGFCWLLFKVPSKALEYYKKALELDDQFVLAYIGKAVALYGEGKFEEAMQSIETAASIDSKLYEELANYDREMLVVGVNRFLYEIAKYTPDWKLPGTTLQTEGFQYNEVDIGGKKIHNYLLQPSQEYKITESQIRTLLDDLSKRVNKSIDKLNLLVVGHGW